MAYNTNENLLVAAPTGAGKTNIALLTITHEIRNNIKEGVLKKDSFKVGINCLLIYRIFGLCTTISALLVWEYLLGIRRKPREVCLMSIDKESFSV